jgi:hypothetical protein
MTVKLSCAALAALSLTAGQALAQDAAAPAAQAAPVEQTAPAAPAAAPEAPQETPAAPAPEAAPAPASAPAATPAPVAAAAATEATLGKPAAGKGQVVFFRPSKFVGMAIGFKVREGETELGKLGNGNFFVIDVEPGAHEYVVHSEAKDILPLEIDAGEVYYVEGGIGMGVMVGRPNLSPSDKIKFESAGKLKTSKLKS